MVRSSGINENKVTHRKLHTARSAGQPPPVRKSRNLHQATDVPFLGRDLSLPEISLQVQPTRMNLEAFDIPALWMLDSFEIAVGRSDGWPCPPHKHVVAESNGATGAVVGLPWRLKMREGVGAIGTVS